MNDVRQTYNPTLLFHFYHETHQNNTSTTQTYSHLIPLRGDVCSDTNPYFFPTIPGQDPTGTLFLGDVQGLQSPKLSEHTKRLILNEEAQARAQALDHTFQDSPYTQLNPIPGLHLSSPHFWRDNCYLTPQAFPTSGRICYLHKNIRSPVLQKQVGTDDYRRILGHPIIILGPSPRAGDFVFAIITTFGGRTLEEKFNHTGRFAALKKGYLAIRHDNENNNNNNNREESTSTPILELQNRRRLRTQSYVQVSRKGILSVEAENIRPFRNSGVEVELTEGSMRDLLAYHEMLVETDDELWDD
ncbi:hypothetical protein IWZ00DRAFT_493171 [Phyllosticta capitalensis]